MSTEFQISEDLALNGGVCPKCGRYFRANGVGPKDNQMLTSMLNALPSSHILKYGAGYHDWMYHFGGAEEDRKFADDVMFLKNEERIKEKIPGYQRWFYHACNWRNYIMVRTFGKKHFGKDNCAIPDPQS